MRPVLLVLASTYPRWAGDAEPAFLHALSRRMTGHFEVHVLCPHAPGAARNEVLDDVHVHRYRYAPDVLETLVQSGGILANLRSRPWKWLLLPAFLLAQFCATVSLLRSLQPAAVHAHWIIAQGLVVALARRLGLSKAPWLLTSHGGDLFGLRGGLFARIKRAVIRSADAMTVVSAAARDAAVRLGANPASTAVAPMGVDFELFSPDAGVVRNRHELLFVGRLVEKKGLVHLLHALPTVLQRHPATSLTVVGDGPERDSLVELSAQLGVTESVHFVGAMPQTELPRRYRTAAVFVAPFVEARDGDQEGLGLVTIEALACGCPAIVSDLPAVRDVIDPEFVPGALVPPGDSQALARALCAHLDAPESAYEGALLVRERLRGQFAWPVVADGYAKRIAALIGIVR